MIYRLSQYKAVDMLEVLKVLPNWQRHIVFIWIVLLICSLTACSASSQENFPEATTLIYATLDIQYVDREAVSHFNHTHTDVQIEVRDYSTGDANGKTGRDRLMTEIMAGNCPDILDLGSPFYKSQLPYRQLAEKGYLENLWPYIERDPELGRDGLMDAPLKAAEVNGGLYAAFAGVTINTLVGAEDMVGERYSWSLEDLLATLDTMPEESVILPACYTKSTVLFYMLGMDLESYIDWETGECTFDSDRFRSALEFINSFPMEFNWNTVDAEEINEEWNSQILNGQQMLSSSFLMTHMQDIQIADALFGGRAAFIGYPVEDDSVGSSFSTSFPRLAIATRCRNKEAAWEFIRQQLLPDSKSKKSDMIPINRQEFSMWCNELIDVVHPYTIAGHLIELHQTTEEEINRFLRFYNRIEKINFWDTQVYEIVEDATGPYFAGDRTLDDTITLIQNRVGLYLNEQK